MFFEKKEEESICSFLLRAFHLSSAKMHFAIKKKEKKKLKHTPLAYSLLYTRNIMKIKQMRKDLAFITKQAE